MIKLLNCRIIAKTENTLNINNSIFFKKQTKILPTSLFNGTNQNKFISNNNFSITNLNNYKEGILSKLNLSFDENAEKALSVAIDHSIKYLTIAENSIKQAKLTDSQVTISLNVGFVQLTISKTVDISKI